MRKLNLRPRDVSEAQVVPKGLGDLSASGGPGSNPVSDGVVG